MADNDQNNLKQLPMTKSIGSVLDLEKELAGAVNIENIFNRAVNVIDCELRDGRLGQYIVLEIQEVITGEEYKVQTGSVIPTRVMTKIKASNMFPVSCVFFKEQGKDLITLRDVEDTDLG